MSDAQKVEALKSAIGELIDAKIAHRLDGCQLECARRVATAEIELEDAIYDIVKES